MPTCTIEYDGVNPGGTITATISDAVVGQEYGLNTWSRFGTADYQIAISSTLILVCTNVQSYDDESFLAAVFNNGTGEPVGAATFDVRVAGFGRSNPSDLIPTWDGVDTFTLTYDAQGFGLWVGQWWGTGGAEDDSGNSGTLSFTVSGSPYGDIIDVEVSGADDSWYHDIASFWIFPGDTTVYTSGGIPGVLSANFTGSPVAGPTPLIVDFTDSSIPGAGGAITDWEWDFGDGGTSSAQSPSHTYTEPGTYTVSLTVTSPDGTDTITKTEYIAVGVSPTNIDCDHAIALAPAGGIMAIDSTWAPDTPLEDDPANFPLGYEEGYQFRRQTWYKLTNTDSKPRFALFGLHNTSTTKTAEIFAGLYFGSCADLKAPWNTPYNDQYQAEFNDYLPVPFDDGYPWVNNDFFWGTLANVGYTGSYFFNPHYVGILVLPGQTVYLELAGDDDEGINWPSFKTITLTWALLAVNQYDAIDLRLPEYGGQSEIYPSNTPLNISGFDTVDVGFGAGGVGLPAHYVHHNEYHFIAGFSSKEVAKPSGYSGNCDWHEDQLGVWQIDSSGSQVDFQILETMSGVGSVSLIGNSTCGSRWDRNKVRLLSDGTNLWCIALAREPVANPYSGGHDWSVYHLVVYAWDGSWSRIGATISQTTNQDFFQSIGGGFGEYNFIWSAHARDGVLHVLYSEEGVCDAPDPHVLDLAPWYGISPRHWRNCFTYAKFSNSGIVDQFNILEEDHPADDGVVFIQNAYSAYLAVRADDSGDAIAIWSPPRTDGTEGYKDTIEIYSLAGGASLVKTITATDGLSSKPPDWFGADPDKVPQDWGITINSAIDIGFDSKDVYFFTVRFDKIGGDSYYCQFRLPTDDPTDLRYFDDDPALPATYHAPSPQPDSYLVCEEIDTWLVGSNIYLWSRACSLLVEWVLYGHGGGNLNSYYPGMQAQIGEWKSSDDFFYFASTYYGGSNPYGYGTPYAYGLGRSKILRNFWICSIFGAPIGQASIFWFYKDGEWHNAGNDDQYNLWYYRDGQWRSHLSDSQHWLYGQLETTWQN